MVLPVLETLSTRLKSPYYGSFVLAWIISCWQPLYVTFFVSVDELPRIPGTDIRYTDKLSYIWDLDHLGWCRLLLIPLAFGFLTPLAIQGAEGFLAYWRKWIEQYWAEKGKTDFDEAYVLETDLNLVKENLSEALKQRDLRRDESLGWRKQFEVADRDLGNIRSGSDKLQSQLDAAEERVKQLEEAANGSSERIKSAERQRSEAQTAYMTELSKREEIEQDVVKLVEQIWDERSITHQALKYMAEVLERVNQVTNGLRDTAQLATFVKGRIEVHNQAELDRALGGYPAPLVSKMTK